MIAGDRSTLAFTLTSVVFTVSKKKEGRVIAGSYDVLMPETPNLIR